MSCKPSCTALECSPLRRGWSHSRSRQHPPKRVLPAQAGVVPFGSGHAHSISGAPRSGGGGPLNTIVSCGMRWCSPLRRGWSPEGQSSADPAVVLPAQAGVVPAIAQLASLYLEEPLHLAGLDGVPVRYVECTNENAIEAADEVVNQLLNDGWAPGDICVLTTGSRHPIQRDKAVANRQTYWDEFFEGDAVFYGHVLGFKGLERRVIVLAINGWKVEDQKKAVV